MQGTQSTFFFDSAVRLRNAKMAAPLNLQLLSAAPVNVILTHVMCGQNRHEFPHAGVSFHTSTLLSSASSCIATRRVDTAILQLLEAKNYLYKYLEIHSHVWW